MKYNCKTFRSVVIASVFILICAAVFVCNTQSHAMASQSEEIVFGAIEPLSGPISMVGLQFVRTFELFFDKINEEGGITIDNKNYKFKFVSADSKYSAEGAVIAAKKLIFDEGATFVTGGVAEFETAGVYSISQKTGALCLAISNFPGSKVDVAPDRPMLIRPQYSVDDGNTVVLDYLKKTYPNVKTIGLSLADFGSELLDPVAENFKHAAKARGFDVVELRWDVNTIDFMSVMTKLLAQKPDAICAYQSGQGAQQYRAARQLGFTGPIFDTCPLGAEAYLYIEPNMTDFFCTGPNPNDMLPAMQEVRKRWEAKYSDPFLSDATQVWDMAAVLIQGMKKANSVEPAKVLAALESMTNAGDVDSVFGPARMGGMERFGTNRVLIKQIPLTQVTDGQMKLIGYFSGTYR